MHDDRENGDRTGRKRIGKAVSREELVGELPPFAWEPLPAAEKTAPLPSGTFAVTDVTTADTRLAEVGYRDAVETVLGGRRIESCPSRLHTNLVPAPYHPFVYAVHRSFNDHRPLAISPDHVWLLICQGFAAHVNANADALRHRLVNFEGKQRIDVRRDEFVKGSMENPWEDVFPEFVAKLAAYLGPAADLTMPRFSTTGAVETAACQITLMDAVQPYFEYRAYSGCGIPTVTLEGTAADWQLLSERAERFRPYDLDWWLDPLADVLEQFRAAATGDPRVEWWQSFYKIESRSGGPFINGHMLKLLPYLKHWETKAVSERSTFRLATMDGLPSGLSRAPFEWNVWGRPYEMEFVGGFVGVRQGPDDLTLRPEIGWAVRER